MTTSVPVPRPAGGDADAGEAVGRGGPVVHLDPRRYTDEAWAARERERLWPRVWQLACSVDHVREPGDVAEHRCGPLSVIVVRGDDGALRAFQNACRHRGSALCDGSAPGLEQLRCPYHRWTWDLRGRLREIPSRREYPVGDADLDLVPARVECWGPLVFVNLDLDAEPLADFLGGAPADAAWADLDAFACTATVSVPVAANWKTVIDGFSETYHVQGIHREMLPMCDDVHGPMHRWPNVGKLTQPYGVASPRCNPPPTDQEVWEAFVEVMGTRVGLAAERSAAGEAPAVPEGSTIRAVIAERVRATQAARGVDLSHLDDARTLDMAQYNVFPNITVLVFSDMLNVVRARPGASVGEAWMDAWLFERRPAGAEPAGRPFDLVAAPGDDVPLGLVLGQDLANLERAQRGLHQPGLAHLVVSATEEFRIVALHEHLDRWLGDDEPAAPPA